MSTVIVPAHNEAAVIRACLDSITKQLGDRQLIVACNGCSDDSADIVRANYPQAVVLESDVPSKTHALNMAEAHVKTISTDIYPIFYLDADTQIAEGALQAMEDFLADGPAMLTAPMPNIDTQNSSVWVKMYYRVWLALPYVKRGVIATCSFAVGEQGRQRFDAFPKVIADDGFIRSHFTDDEIANTVGAQINIIAPSHLMSLIKIKTRARLGNMELNARGLAKHQHRKQHSQSIAQVSVPWHEKMVYIGIALIIRIRAWWQFRHLDSYQWEVDDSSRRQQ